MVSPIRIHGKVRGRFIEIDRDLGLPDGAEVTLSVQGGDVPRGAPELTGEGIRLSAGGWAEDAAELDQYLEWNRKQRKVGRPSDALLEGDGE